MTFRIRSDFDVELMQHVGSDEMICKAARVSTLGAESIGSSESAGLLTFLMRNRHGSPFEHGSMTFRITAPIFVWREFMRHRIGFSYNEESGRYKELDPVFYIPPMSSRMLVQTGKAGAYTFRHGTPAQYHEMQASYILAYKTAWESYQNMLASGIAREVSRCVLPVGIYSTAYVTCNPRSLMAFLSLRTKVEGSLFPSYPQWEINEVASLMEEIFSDKFPTTHDAFCAAGRVSP